MERGVNHVAVGRPELPINGVVELDVIECGVSLCFVITRDLQKRRPLQFIDFVMMVC